MIAPRQRFGFARNRSGSAPLWLSIARPILAMIALVGVLAAMVSWQPGPAQGQTPASGAQGDAAPVMLVADELEYDQENQLIIARGNVEVIQGGQIILADEITIFQAENRARADGNIVIVQPSGEVIFGSTAELTDDFNEGFIRNISMLLADDTRMAAVSGRRVDGVEMELYRVVASPCRECAGESIGRPLWQIRASRVVHNAETRNVIYRHARFEIFGVPVFYTPYLSHPDPTVRRRSGFLTPLFGSNSDLGVTARVPYFVTLGPSRDFVFDPMFTTKETVLVAGEYRQRFSNGQLRARFGVTKEVTGSERVRSHFDSEFDFNINDYWRAGGHLQIASDDTFLERYGINFSDTLVNRLYAEGFSPRNYASVEALAFQGLNSEDIQDRSPIVAPLINVALVGEPQYVGGFLGGRYAADLNMRAITREQGIDSQRISGIAAWRLPVNGLIGDQMAIEVSVRGDVFRVENSVLAEIPVPRAFDGIRGRFYPQLKVDWRLPFVRAVGQNVQQFFEPVAQLVIAPNGGNPDGIPDEDSILFEFDETSLFSGNRFPGLDRVEGGKHFAYGVNFGVVGINGGTATAFIGQSFQFQENFRDLRGTGIENHFSDFVVRVEANPLRFIEVLYKARLDKDDFTPRRTELAANVGVPQLRLNVDYVFFEAFSEFPRREEITFGVSSRFAEHWRGTLNLRRDLTGEGNTLSYGGSISYHCDCLDLELIYRRDFTTDRDVDPEDTFLLRATLRHLGQLESQVF